MVKPTMDSTWITRDGYNFDDCLTGCGTGGGGGGGSGTDGPTCTGGQIVVAGACECPAGLTW